MKGIRRGLMAMMFILCSASYADEDRSSVTVSWGYKGNNSPAFWARLDPAFSLCATGKAQSPINIPKKVKPGANTLSIQYNPSVMHIVDDGTTDLQIGKTHTIILDGHGVQLNYTEMGNKEEIILDGKKYHLVQFHFHTPSETAWHNQAYPLEIHFVHQSDDGSVAVIAVFAKAGVENATIKKIIDHLPKEQGVEATIPSEIVNPIDLLPQDHVHYYRFMGSLTTPPCTEGIQWVVMANAITLSPGQIVSIRRAANGPNARPVQPLNKRIIAYVNRETT